MDWHNLAWTGIAVFAFAVSGCNSRLQSMLDAGATRLNPAEVQAHIVGKTETWVRGGGYYAENGTIEVLWKGRQHRGTYDIGDNGEVCYRIPGWSEHCHYYLNDNGAIAMVSRSNPDVKKMLPGNRLAEL